MKKLILLALMMLSSVAFAQNKDTIGLNIPQVNGMVVYQRTVKAPQKSTAILFDRSKAWFDKRYVGLDSVKTQDAATGQLIGRGWEKLAFKGPLGLEVANRAGMKIEITSATDSYDVRISNIVLGYMEDPALPRIYFTAEDMMDKVLGNKLKNELGYNPTPFNIKRSTKAFISLNDLISDVLKSIDQEMNAK